MSLSLYGRNAQHMAALWAASWLAVQLPTQSRTAAAVSITASQLAWLAQYCVGHHCSARGHHCCDAATVSVLCPKAIASCSRAQGACEERVFHTSSHQPPDLLPPHIPQVVTKMGQIVVEGVNMKVSACLHCPHVLCSLSEAAAAAAAATQDGSTPRRRRADRPV
jgi:hypothetical protein